MSTEKKILYAMQAIILLLAAMFIYAIIFCQMTPEGKEHSKTVLGFLLGTVISTLITFNWGTSKGSVDKTEAAEKRLDAVIAPPDSSQSKTKTIPAVESEKKEGDL